MAMPLRLPIHLLPPNIPAPALKLAVAAGVAVAVMSMRAGSKAQKTHFVLASMSLSSSTLTTTGTKDNVVVEATTGMQFPKAIQSEEGGKLELAGTGLRKKSILGLKSIIVYAFGMYVNGSRVSNYVEKKSEKSVQLSELPCMDTEMSVRLVIVYGKLKIGSVRSAFEESVGGRITKFTGSDNKQLLHSFTGLFKDDIKLPKGTTIDLVRAPGHVLRTKINGEEIGTVKSELLCRCVFDLYIGDEPFDEAGRDSIAAGLTCILNSHAK